jgi:hypothetical protein
MESLFGPSMPPAWLTEVAASGAAQPISESGEEASEDVTRDLAAELEARVLVGGQVLASVGAAQ